MNITSPSKKNDMVRKKNNVDHVSLFPEWKCKVITLYHIESGKLTTNDGKCFQAYQSYQFINFFPLWVVSPTVPMNPLVNHHYVHTQKCHRDLWVYPIFRYSLSTWQSQIPLKFHFLMSV